MKRTRFFVVILLVLFVFTGNFSSPKIANAQTTTNTTQTYAGAKQAILQQFSTNESIYQSKYNAAQNTAYNKELVVLNTSFSNSLENYSGKTPTDNNIKDFELEALDVFSKHLETILSSSPEGNEIDQVRKDMKAVADAIYVDIKTSNQDAGLMQSLGGGIVTNNAQTITNANAANLSQAKTQGALPPPKCSLTSFSLADCLDSGFAWIITHTLLALAGWFLWITATLMNYAINIGILQFSDWAPNALYPIWVIIRQIVSLFIVFAGLWLGFMYIINKSEKLESYIPWVVMFALFVNFSYPLTRTLVDVSNIVSLNLYASAIGSDTLEAKSIDISSDKTAGAIIRDRLGLKGLVDFATQGSTASMSLNAINSTGPALLAVIYIAYAAWIFFLVSALIITRTAVLVFLIVASPLLFVDAAVPYLGDEAQKLRGIFWEMLFVGPVFTVMLALTLKFLEVFQNNGLLKGSLTPTDAAGQITMFFNILMMLIMLHIMLKVTKATSGKLGATITETMGRVGGSAISRAALGGAGMLGRATIGRGAAALRDSKWMDGKQEHFLGRHLYNMTDSVAKSGFDVRNSSYVQTGAKKLGLGMGMGQKMGREALIEARDKNLEAHLGRIGTHKKNVYNEDGSLKYKKGALDSSEEAQAARQNYIKNAGGALFATKQEKDDLRYNLGKADTDEKRTKTNEKTSTQNKAVSDYSKLTNEEEKKKFSDAQDPETQARIKEYEKKKAEDSLAKTADKEDRDKKHQETIAAANRTAEAQEKMLEALKKASDSSRSAVASTPSQKTIPPTTSSGNTKLELETEEQAAKRVETGERQQNFELESKEAAEKRITATTKPSAAPIDLASLDF